MALNQVPQAGQSLAATQVPVLGNFSIIDTTFSVDHVSYMAMNAGMHNQIQIPAHSGSIPANAGNFVLFNQNLTLPTNQAEIWLGRGAGTPFPMTGYVVSGNNGWTYLPSGILMCWGFATSPGSGNTTVTYNSTAGGGLDSFPGFNTQATPTITRYGSGVNVLNLVSYVPGNFVASRGGGSGTYEFSWLAIGI